QLMAGTGGMAGRLAVLLGYAVPLMFMLFLSFKSQPDMLADPGNLLFVPTLDGYRSMIGDAWPAMMNSFQIAAGTTVVTLALATPAAYGLARRRSRGWSRTAGAVLAGLIVIQMVPQAIGILPLYQIMVAWGLANTIAGVAVATAAIQIPFAILLLRPFFVSIPIELEEAASVDGASLATTFLRVSLPLARNGMVTLSIMVFVAGWGEFLYGTTLLATPDGYPVSALLAQQETVYETLWGRLMALGVLITLPILALFLVSQRRLVTGMLAGGVK
ncbi:MAG: carbohydrate ABC transporter permease, partial [Kutzneria sp.]|nr:carbohydrate ABC transporter permease [Kutzneria sp.]